MHRTPMNRWTPILTALLAAAWLAACAEPASAPDSTPATAEGPGNSADAGHAATNAEAAAAAATVDAGAGEAADADQADAGFKWPTMTVYKTPACGCCVMWIEHAQAAGIPVETVDIADLGPTKQKLGVPYGKGSCHTATIGGYFIEGHVPIGDIRRLLVERPDARGLTLPGMPLGSPGMETPDGRSQAFTVELVARDGSTRAWAHHPQR